MTERKTLRRWHGREKAKNRSKSKDDESTGLLNCSVQVLQTLTESRNRQTLIKLFSLNPDFWVVSAVVLLIITTTAAGVSAAVVSQKSQWNDIGACVEVCVHREQTQLWVKERCQGNRGLIPAERSSRQWLHLHTHSKQTAVRPVVKVSTQRFGCLHRFFQTVASVKLPHFHKSTRTVGTNAQSWFSGLFTAKVWFLKAWIPPRYISFCVTAVTVTTTS